MLMRIINGFTTYQQNQDGHWQWGVEDYDGTVYPLTAGDHLTVWGKDDEVVFNGPIILDRSLELASVPGALYDKYIPNRQIGWDGAQWHALFNTYTTMHVDSEPVEVRAPAHLRARVIRLAPLNWFYGVIDGAFNTRLPEFDFHFSLTKGQVDGFFETGTEGVWWTLYEKRPNPYEGLHMLESGDFLTVWDDENHVLFNGFLLRDGIAGWEQYPMNPSAGQPCALGLWVHWTQHGWHPDEWAQLFYKVETREDGRKVLHDSNYRARLIEFGPLRFIGGFLERRLNAKKATQQKQALL